jgi:hypothetical protein
MVTSEHEVEIHISPYDIELIYERSNREAIDSWLRQMNDIAVFLKGSPAWLIDELSTNQAMTIAEAIVGIARTLIEKKHD